MAVTDRPSARAFTRVPVHIAVRAVADDGTEVRGVLRDVSVRGLSLVTPGTLPVGAARTLRILLETGGRPLELSARGRVLRSAQGIVAFELTEVDADDFEHLRKLVLYNAPSARRIEEEIEAHVDDQPTLAHLHD